jgi:hypothetical protein
MHVYLNVNVQSVLRGLAAIRAVTGSTARVTVGLPTDILSRFESDSRLVKAVSDAQEALGTWKKTQSEVRVDAVWTATHGSTLVSWCHPVSGRSRPATHRLRCCLAPSLRSNNNYDLCECLAWNNSCWRRTSWRWCSTCRPGMSTFTTRMRSCRTCRWLPRAPGSSRCTARSSTTLVDTVCVRTTGVLCPVVAGPSGRVVRKHSVTHPASNLRHSPCRYAGLRTQRRPHLAICSS